MRKQFLFAACTLFAASALVMTSCQQTEEPIANDPTDQAGPMSDNQIKTYTTAAKNANARGVAFFNLPMSSYRLSSFNAAAQAFGETVSHTGKTYSKDYGN